MRSDSGGSAGVVDDVADLALVVEGDGDHVVKAHVGVDGDLDGAGKDDVRMAEDAVDAEAPGFVGGDFVGDLVGGPAVGAGGAGEAGLVGGIVGDFGLIEVGAAIVAVPEDLELLVMLDEEPVGSDVVGVDDEAVGAGVRIPANAGSVIGTPDPGVVDDGVVGVDLKVDYGTADAGTADAEEDVMKGDGIFFVGGFAFGGADLKKDGRGCGAGIEEEAGDDDSFGVGGGDGGGAVDRA